MALSLATAASGTEREPADSALAEPLGPEASAVDTGRSSRAAEAEISEGEAAPEVVRTPIGPFVEPPEGLAPLNEILERMARGASLYLDKALSFTANERTEVFTHYRGRTRSYLAPDAVYCYYNTDRGRLDDHRISKRRMARLRKRLSKGEDITAELLDAPDPLRNNSAVPAYAVRPYTWMVLFSRGAQRKYRYRIEGMADEGLWLSLEPSRAEPEPSDWYGDVLVDLDTYQILRARGFQHESVEEMRRARALLESDGQLPPDEIDRTFVEMHLYTEFRPSDHGIRLPSKVLTEVHHHTIVQPLVRRYDRKRLVYEIVQKYKNYEFFRVRVHDRVRDRTSP